METIGIILGILTGLGAVAGGLWRVSVQFAGYKQAADTYTKALLEVKNDISELGKKFDDYKMLNDSRVATIMGRLDAIDDNLEAD